ncbi:hypothetical protein [Janthinobacterium sp. 17J80-10]|uniref:hypothetical protein n=1 Tax=Janthinobacterium sp. 17J80-10 TaxID=2497863 RepID=UPI0010053B55|nr:hypothetical protein [Janthinobacterium sp. 17J80-10]QAU32728.1 hypothetical protein EKL02_00285 [Janthinobacterium sp. 17J80-10]
MQLEKLQIDLRPRSHAQAIELGLALLRAHAGTVYNAWLALWLPLVLLAAGLAYVFPGYGSWWLLLPWWLRPLLERAPLYILSRQVFGEAVSWREALRAWPGQLRGGWIRLLTWWRPVIAGRGLYQPIWQLEGARGKTAAERRRVIGADGTARSAYWFGVVCAHLEVILQLGLIAFIGIFLADENAINPFAYLFDADAGPASAKLLVASFAGYALSGAIIGPVYAACCFTLYLCRRATLEAWDIEIMLRQLKAPAARRRSGAAMAAVPVLAGCLLAALLALGLPVPAQAAAKTVSQPTMAQKCAEPEWAKSARTVRPQDRSAAQAQLRQELAQLYATDDLASYRCVETWEAKTPSKPKPDKDWNYKWPDLAVLAEIIRIGLIAAAVLLVAWLLYRYRGQFTGWFGQTAPQRATEIGGLDIRPESLPGDIVGNVLKLWHEGARRAALALLYRATVSRLASEDGLPLTRGATEADCLRLAGKACREQRLAAGRLQVTASVTALWLDGAYGDRWPATEQIGASCLAWQEQFSGAAAGKAAA